MVAQPRFTPARGMSPERVNRRKKKSKRVKAVKICTWKNIKAKKTAGRARCYASFEGEVQTT